MKQPRGNYKRTMILPYLVPFADKFSKAGSITLTSGVDDVFMTHEQVLEFDRQFNKHSLMAYKLTVKAIEEDGEVMSRIQAGSSRININVDLPEPSEEYEAMRTAIVNEKIKAGMRSPIHYDPMMAMNEENVTLDRLEILSMEYPLSLQTVCGIYDLLKGPSKDKEPTMTELRAELEKVVMGNPPSNVEFKTANEIECNQDDVHPEKEDPPEMTNTERIEKEESEIHRGPAHPMEAKGEGFGDLNEVDVPPVKEIPILFFSNEIDAWCPLCWHEEKKKSIIGQSDILDSMKDRFPYAICSDHRRFVTVVESKASQRKMVMEMIKRIEEVIKTDKPQVEYHQYPKVRRGK